MKNINISFGSNHANADVDFSVRKNEIMALLGENGAGKSTLMKILYGLYQKDSGTVWVDGEKMPFHYTPEEMLSRGVSMVSQQFMLVNAFTVEENVILGMEKEVSKFRYDTAKVHAYVQKLCDRFEISLPLDSVVADLPPVVKQRVEILKALSKGNKVVILDEPTTVLTPDEVGELFDLLRGLKAKGISVVLIAHKLQEVLDVTDRITIMRQGRYVATVNTSEVDAHTLSEMMVGHSLNEVSVALTDEAVQPTIHLDHISTEKVGDRCNLRDLSLDLYPGRVVGIAGIDGNGQTELVEVLAGIKAMQEGAIDFNGKTITENTPQNMRECGIGIIPEDRREQGLVLDLTIRDNILIGHRDDPELYSKRGMINMKKANAFVDRLIEEFDIRPANRNVVTRFVSGGNQQKIVLARELTRSGLQLVVAAQPIRGLDVGAIEFTHSTLLRFRAEGKAVLLISSDLDEIRELSDYIAVLSEGSIVACKPAAQFPNNEIGMYMGGMKSADEEVTA